jgi:hypothetical protein
MRFDQPGYEPEAEGDFPVTQDAFFGCHRNVQLVSVHEHATGNTDEKDVQAESDAAPEVHLKYSFPNPDSLRLLHPALPCGPSMARLHRFTAWLLESSEPRVCHRQHR